MDIRLIKKSKIKEVIEYKDNNYFIPGEYLVVIYDDNSYTLLDKNYDYLYGKKNSDIKNEIRNIKTLSNCSSEGEKNVEGVLYNYDILLGQMAAKIKEKYGVKLTYDSQIYYIKPENKLYDSMMKDYEKTLNLFEKRCKKLNIKYEKNPDKLVFDAVKKLNEKEYVIADYKTDISYCYSTDTIDKELNELEKNLTTEWDYEKAKSDLQYTCLLLANYVSDFFRISNRAILALIGKSEVDKEILKAYTEFLISMPKYVKTREYLVSRASKLGEKRQQMRNEKFHSDETFIEEINKIIAHDSNSSEYLYHVPQTEEDAKKILEEGLYMFSDRMSSSTISELTTEEILQHGYGSNFQYFEEYVVVIDKPINADIIEEIPEEKRNYINIMPRRPGLVNKKPTHVIPSQYVVGYIDKEQLKVVYNPNYKKEDKNNGR